MNGWTQLVSCVLGSGAVLLLTRSASDAVAQEEGSASRQVYDGPSRPGGRSRHVDAEDEGNDYEGEGIVADDVIDED